MEKRLVNVVFDGKIAEGKDPEEVKAAVRRLFKLDEARVEKLFHGSRTIIKRNAALENAKKIQVAMKRAGAHCSLDFVPPRNAYQEEPKRGVGVTTLTLEGLRESEEAPEETLTTELSGTVSMEKVEILWEKSIDLETRPGTTIKCPDNGMPQDYSTLSRLSVGSHGMSAIGEQHDPPPDYELIRILGEGGMGIVYEARQTSIDRVIAVKMLKKEARDNESVTDKFLVEAAVTGDLDHPNIVPIHDVGSNNQSALFYAMKRVQGIPWSKALSEKSLDENLDILTRMADAVAFAHSKGIIHRDLKPENVMLGEYGEVLVMDWGLAVSLSEKGKAQRLNKASSIAGTPRYMAPEMARGQTGKIGACSDVYLLGAILFEIITGKKAHPGKNVMECIHNAANNLIQPAEKKGELVGIALKAMATDPKDRYQSVVNFQAAIRDYKNHSESLTLSIQAADNLHKAKETQSYDDFAQALFGFREALNLWQGNRHPQGS